MWKERILSLVITTILVLSTTSFITIDEAEGSNRATLYVGGTGVGNYSTIQSAIDNAIDWDTVFVYNGTYYENININKNGIKLIGENKNTTIIDGGGTGDVVYVSSNWVNVSGFTIQNSDDYGIYISDSSNYTTIMGNNITNNNHIGIALYSFKNNTILDNTITQCNHSGIYLSSSSNNTIMGNTITYSNRGINIHSPCNNTTIIMNTITHNDYSITLSGDCHNSTITENTIAHNRYGINIYSSSITISGNTITNNTYGIWLFGNNYAVMGNTITHNDEGIHLPNSDNNTIAGNIVTYNNNGIILSFSCNNTITNNTITHNHQRGIEIKYSSSNNNTITGNIIAYSSEYGIYLFQSLSNTFMGNIITKCNHHGISLSASSSNNTITGNTITQCNHSGISIFSSSNNNTIKGNTITQCNHSGIYSWFHSNNNSITGNTITQCNHSGIHLLVFSNNNTVKGNNITHNNVGIDLSSDCNTIEDNVITNNYGTGIELSSSDNNTIMSNTLTGNTGEGLYINPFSSNNKIFHNNFLNNVPSQARDTNEANTWDDGYPSGGNYWDDYDEPSEGAWDNNSDGIVDTPYDIPGGSNQDLYPLMNPWIFVSSYVYVDDNYTPSTPGWGVDHFDSIQDGIDAVAVDGTVFVFSGIYVEPFGANIERVGIYKSLSLIGENRETTIIYGPTTDHNETGIRIGAGGEGLNNVTIRGFTVNGSSQKGIGIYPQWTCSNITIEDCITYNLAEGISLRFSCSNSIIRNCTSYNNSRLGGIVLAENGYSNIEISGCTSYNNNYGILINEAINSRFYHNNLYSNTINARDDGNNTWDNGYPSGGNYWSDFDEPNEGAWDNNSDGIVDSPYDVPDGSNQDQYPLVHPYGSITNLDTGEIFLTIQNAIDDPDTLDGHTIYVKNGTYIEGLGPHLRYLEIDKSIKLMGENKETTILDCPSTGLDEIGIFIDIGIENVTVSGFTVRGHNPTDSGASGIYPQMNCANITIEDCIVHSFNEGIKFRYSCSNSIIRNCTTYNNNRRGGICLLEWDYSNIEISGCTSYANSHGINIADAVNCTISCNTITNNTLGISLDSSNDNTITGNTIITNNNKDGIYLESSSGNTITGNTITNNTQENTQDGTWNIRYGIWLKSSCNNNTISGNTITTSDYCICLSFFSNYNTVAENILTNSNCGIELAYSCISNTVMDNTVSDNIYGIYLQTSSSNNTVAGNTITNHNKEGMLLVYSSSNNIIMGNTIIGNNWGIALYSSSNDNAIMENTITNNNYGIYLDSTYSTSNNKIYHNNFINNTNQAYDSETNYWDDGYPSGGNYWDDYDEWDSYNGPNQDNPGGDGIGDTPYTIMGDSSQDNYPLMNYPLQYGVELSCSNVEKTVPPKGNTTYEIIVTNTGNIADNISIPLPLPCDCGWIESLNTESVELLPNQNMTIFLKVSTIWDFVPIHLGYWITTITATSQGDPTKSDTLTVNTSIIDWTTVSIDPPSQTINGGESFTINITLDPIEAIAGAQFDLAFDSLLLTCNNVMEGDLFQAHDTYFIDGTIDNNNGTITGVAGITIEGNTSLEGTFAIINFTTKNNSGTSSLNLTNVGVGTPEGVSLILKIYNGSVTVVWEPWDINRDGRTNILDLILIGQHWGETGPPCWIPYDVNCDGMVNILDMILVGQHWTG